MNQPPEQRQHRIHRKGAIGDLVRRDEQYIRTGITDHDTQTIYRALMVSPDLETCEALLRGETVPKHRLHQLWTRAFGRRT